jgi:hypothetical protein
MVATARTRTRDITEQTGYGQPSFPRGSHRSIGGRGAAAGFVVTLALRGVEEGDLPNVLTGATGDRPVGLTLDDLRRALTMAGSVMSRCSHGGKCWNVDGSCSNPHLQSVGLLVAAALCVRKWQSERDTVTYRNSL